MMWLLFEEGLCGVFLVCGFFCVCGCCGIGLDLLFVVFFFFENRSFL